MTRQPRILIIGEQHGTEPFGSRIYRYVQSHFPEKLDYIDYLCGNPKALRQKVRFIETDLNRSFVTPAISYEQKRAQKILDLIHQGKYDYVLDVHTTVAKTERFILVAGLTAVTRQMIGASTIEKIALMPPAIASCSLIGNVPQAMSVEYNREAAATDAALHEMLKLLDNLASHTRLRRPREVYEVERTIPLDSLLNHQARNFALSNMGYYPVLMDEGTYGTYRGFMAPTKKELVL